MASPAVYANNGSTSARATTSSTPWTPWAARPNCSGSPKTCIAAVDRSTTGGVVRSSAVGGRTAMVYVGIRRPPPRRFRTPRARRTARARPVVCTPLWSATTGAAVASSPSSPRCTSTSARSMTSSTPTSRGWHPGRPARPTRTSGLSPCQLQDAYELPSPGRRRGPHGGHRRRLRRSQRRGGPGHLPGPVRAAGLHHRQRLLHEAEPERGGRHATRPATRAGPRRSRSTSTRCRPSARSATSRWSRPTTTRPRQPGRRPRTTAGGLHPTAISNSWGGAEFVGEQHLDSNFSSTPGSRSPFRHRRQRLRHRAGRRPARRT